MSSVINGSFDLDGHQFGAGTPIRVRSFDPGPRVVADQDARLPAGHLGRHMGRDTEDGPEWTWDLIIKGGGGAATFDTVQALTTAWKRSHGPGEVSVLRYALPGRMRRVYGRPRRWAATKDAVRYGWHYDHYPVLATFQLADPRIFDDVARSVTLSVVPASVGGLEAPLVAPLSTVRSSAPRAGLVDAAGDAPAPVVVTFQGPITDPWVRGPGWEVGLSGHIAYDQTVTVDALAATATLSPGGASVGGRLTRRTRLRDAVLRPGQQELTFGGSDQTGTATVTITWRDAWWSL